MQRKNGGNSFADAVFRLNAQTRDYARVLTNRIIQRKYGEDSTLGYAEKEKYFVITRAHQPLVCISYTLVEIKRCEAVHAFEEFIEGIL